MGTKAYFMIDVVDKIHEEGRCAEAMRELEAIPEVETVEPVSGTCDFMVKAEVPIRAILVANKIRAKEWVKRLRILSVEPVEPEDATLNELLAEQRKRPRISDLLRIRASRG